MPGSNTKRIATIFDVRSLTYEQFEEGVRKLRKNKKPMVAGESFEREWLTVTPVTSGRNTYEVSQFYHMVFCTCKDFLHGKGNACKHICFILPSDRCRECAEPATDEHSNLCQYHASKERRQAVYMKPSNTKPRDKVGGIPI